MSSERGSGRLAAVHGGGVSRRPLGGLGLLLLTAHCSPLTAQQSAVERERAEFGKWLVSAPTSPLAAVALTALGSGLGLGPAGSDIPLTGLRMHRITERRGRVTLAGPEVSRSLFPGRPVTIGGHTIVAGGLPGRTTVIVYSAPPRIDAKPPVWYPYAATASVNVTLAPPARPGVVRVLAADGIEVEAAEAGTVDLALGGARATLTVRRMPGATPEESELEVYFRDRTNGQGTYPAGRFVALIPLGESRYRLDFNRARNPFCAYSSIYPCPAPWRGNSIAAPVEAGERYSGGGLDPGRLGEQ